MTSAVDDRRDEGLVLDLAEWLDREPWEPVRFQVGQMVRIRVSAECRVIWEGGGPECPPGHPSEFDGLTGYVVSVCSPADPRRSWTRTHPYGVGWKDGVYVAGTDWLWFGNYFCSAELIPLSDTDATAPGCGEGE